MSDADDWRFGQALLTGAVAGMLARNQAEGVGLPTKHVNLSTDDEGDYLPCIEVEMPSGRYRIQVTPAPVDIQEEP